MKNTIINVKCQCIKHLNCFHWRLAFVICPLIPVLYASCSVMSRVSHPDLQRLFSLPTACAYLQVHFVHCALQVLGSDSVGQILSLPLTGSVTLDKLFNLSNFVFSWDVNKNTYHRGLRQGLKIMYAEHLALCLTHSQYSKKAVFYMYLTQTAWTYKYLIC